MVGLRLRLDDGGLVTIGWRPDPGELFVEFPDGRWVTTPFEPEGQAFVLRVFLDQAIVEAFAGRSEVAGAAALTGFMPFGARYESMVLFAESGRAQLTHLDLWELMRVVKASRV